MTNVKRKRNRPSLLQYIQTIRRKYFAPLTVGMLFPSERPAKTRNPLLLEVELLQDSIVALLV